MRVKLEWLNELVDLTGLSLEEIVKTVSLYSIEVEGGDTKSFEDFGKGWVYALQQSLEKPTTVTLGADWIARDGVFYCVDEDGDEYGTDDGYINIDDENTEKILQKPLSMSLQI